MTAVTISFCLDDRRDRDLLDWLRSHTGSRSTAIRDVLRRGIGQAQDITVGDIRQVIRAELAGYAVRQSEGSGVSTASSEPERAAGNLDTLEKRLDDWEGS